MAVTHLGVAGLQRPDTLVAARRSWALPDRVRLLDGVLGPVPAGAYGWLRELLEEFARRADLVVLDAPDLVALYGVPPLRAGRRLCATGAGAVLVRMDSRAGREVSLLICAAPEGAPRADGPADVVLGLPAAPTTDTLRTALAAAGRPKAVPEWLTLTASPGP